MAFEVIKDNDEYILRFFGNQYGMKIPKKTIDDIVREGIRNNPDLKRQVADDYLVRRRRMGRTETEIAGEVLDLAMKFADIMVRGRWTDVAEKAITSGEIRKIIEVLRGRQSPESESLSRPTLAQHPDQPADTSTPLLTKWPEGEPTTGSPPSSALETQPDHQSPQPPEVEKRPDGTGPQETAAVPHEKLPPSMPDAVTIRRFIAAIRRDFVQKVDWVDLEAGVHGDPGDFVAHLWEGVGAGNSGYSVTFISLGDTSAFLEYVSGAVMILREDADRSKEYELAIRVQMLLTETEEGRQWLEAAHNTAVRLFSDRLAEQSGVEETVVNAPETIAEEEDDGDDMLLI